MEIKQKFSLIEDWIFFQRYNTHTHTQFSIAIYLHSINWNMSWLSRVSKVIASNHDELENENDFYQPKSNVFSLRFPGSLLVSDFSRPKHHDQWLRRDRKHYGYRAHIALTFLSGSMELKKRLLTGVRCIQTIQCWPHPLGKPHLPVLRNVQTQAPEHSPTDQSGCLNWELIKCFNWKSLLV